MKCPYSEFFWCIFLHLESVFNSNVENRDQKTQNTDTFRAVIHSYKSHSLLSLLIKFSLLGTRSQNIEHAIIKKKSNHLSNQTLLALTIHILLKSIFVLPLMWDRESRWIMHITRRDRVYDKFLIFQNLGEVNSLWKPKIKPPPLPSIEK